MVLNFVLTGRCYHLVLEINQPTTNWNSKKPFLLNGGFPKWWYPTKHGFPAKNGVFGGHHHLRKNPNLDTSLKMFVSKMFVAPSEMAPGKFNMDTKRFPPKNEVINRYISFETWRQFICYSFLKKISGGYPKSPTYLGTQKIQNRFILKIHPSLIKDVSFSSYSGQIILGGSSQLVYKKLLTLQFLSHFRPCICFR